MRRLILIGTSHRYQCSNRSDDKSLAQQFHNFLKAICQRYSAKAIAEEFSAECLDERKVDKTVAQLVSVELRLQHQFSDPTSTERAAMGVKEVNGIKLQAFFENWSDSRVEVELRQSHDKRESYWLNRVVALEVWPVVFVCGADHVAPFTEKLEKNGIHTEVAC